jgi:hypothetical protein
MVVKTLSLWMDMYVDEYIEKWRYCLCIYVALTTVICTCITFCWYRHLFSTTLIGTVAFGERELCVVVLLSAGPDSYLALL